MIQYRLKEMNEDRVVYCYFPDGGEDFGELEYIFVSEQANVLRRAINDNTGHYARKGTLKVAEKVKEGIGANRMPLKFSQAWY